MGIAPPPTRILSFQQLVLEADPDWQQSYRRPWIYAFSNARKFYQRADIYADYDIAIPPELAAEGGLLLATEDGELLGADDYFVPFNPFPIPLPPRISKVRLAAETGAQLATEGGAALAPDGAPMMGDELGVSFILGRSSII